MTKNNNNNNNKNRKRPLDNKNSKYEPPTKRTKIIVSSDSDSSDNSDSSDSSNNSDNSDNIEYDDIILPSIISDNPPEDDEIIIIDKEINNLSDLIELGKMYNPIKKYNVDLCTLNHLVEPLTELNNMIGMDAVKQDMVDHILFRIQNLDASNQDMCHTVIQGPPGVGKTEVAKIIGRVYLAMGILKNNKFIKATRSQLIAGYLGQTAKATQKMIDSALGGILFIDEVYSLGNSEKRDSFAKECIDTINENLTDKKTDFICIIAGYKDEVDKCFFAYNAGLERRFPVRFTIDPYTPDEIFQIFKKKVYDCGWEIDNSISSSFFHENYEYFKYFGGDMEILFSRCKRAHSRRVFASKIATKKILNMTDIKRGFESFKNHRKDKEESSFWKNLYI
jgi:hypothetical protein